LLSTALRMCATYDLLFAHKQAAYLHISQVVLFTWVILDVEQTWSYQGLAFSSCCLCVQRYRITDHLSLIPQGLDGSWRKDSPSSSHSAASWTGHHLVQIIPLSLCVPSARRTIPSIPCSTICCSCSHRQRTNAHIILNKERNLKISQQ
jgi:hypothetical protein